MTRKPSDWEKFHVPPMTDKYAERAREILRITLRFIGPYSEQGVKAIARALEQAELEALLDAYHKIAELENPYNVDDKFEASYEIGWSNGQAACRARLKELMEGK